MAELKCGAENCGYNQDKCCCKGDIMVGGKHARCEDDTCCESFITKKADSFTSALSHPSRVISIDCEATQCVHNSNYKCVADHVDIHGNGASDSEMTACATFQEK